MNFAAFLFGLLSMAASAQTLSRAPVPVATSALTVVARPVGFPTTAPMAASLPTLSSLRPALLAPAASAARNHAAPVSVAAQAAPVAAMPVAATPNAALPILRAISETGTQSSALWDGMTARSAAAAGESRTPVPLDPPKPPRRGLLKAAKSAIPLFGIVAATAILDIAVVQVYLHELHRDGVAWANFQTTIFGMTVLKWWLYFVPVSSALLAGGGYAVARWRGVLAGVLLFLMGWEDILYYWLRGTSLSETMGWLNDNPFIAWTRWITGTSSVTSTGVYLAAAVGLAAALALLASAKKKLFDPYTGRPLADGKIGPKPYTRR